ncbi:MAG: hypothetical protein MUE40_14945 [Anaerolineae bacterium]|jgi:uncharacterized membrane protein YidH (DUF202 family)|nr:hypothetical protein [Anaerolineae bacterium]
MTRQTRPIVPFNDRVAGISLRWLDYALGYAIGAFILAALVQALRFDDPQLYSVLRHLHNHLGRFTLAVAVFMFGLSLYIGLVRRADVRPYFRRGVYLCVGMMLVEAAMGAVLYFALGARPRDEAHLIYGAGTVLALPFFIYVETTAPKRPALGSYMWGFGLLAGIIIRCLQTGPL